ncbi:hypothetical protein OGAPHI_003566 [Ogataea philodendri]|uniref:Uncharacterized protein n=1 Tax=Ogataea philodendri TaxID=1378263 RepID=A0A9P8P5K6_9ASCO|nr:uncharacterized protein OGAPHI_003566 [Ogataea philodendri]KAH3665382.1 hypothetical protein OGAPHI_003566 [Ogataea philodendri]
MSTANSSLTSILDALQHNAMCMTNGFHDLMKLRSRYDFRAWWEKMTFVLFSAKYELYENALDKKSICSPSELQDFHKGRAVRLIFIINSH